MASVASIPCLRSKTVYDVRREELETCLSTIQDKKVSLDELAKEMGCHHFASEVLGL